MPTGALVFRASRSGHVSPISPNLGAIYEQSFRIVTRGMRTIGHGAYEPVHSKVRAQVHLE